MHIVFCQSCVVQNAITSDDFCLLHTFDIIMTLSKLGFRAMVRVRVEIGVIGLGLGLGLGL